MPAPLTDERRFEKYVDQRGPDDCWPWKGAVTKAGYGLLTRNYQNLYSHIWAFEYLTGVGVERGLVLDHTCHNRDAACAGGSGCLHRRCCNPAHLNITTRGENVRRGRVSKRDH